MSANLIKLMLLCFIIIQRNACSNMYQYVNLYIPYVWILKINNYKKSIWQVDIFTKRRKHVDQKEPRYKEINDNGRHNNNRFLLYRVAQKSCNPPSKSLSTIRLFSQFSKFPSHVTAWLLYHPRRKFWRQAVNICWKLKC